MLIVSQLAKITQHNTTANQTDDDNDNIINVGDSLFSLISIIQIIICIHLYNEFYVQWTWR